MGGLSTVLGGTDIVVGNEEDVTIDGATGGLLKSLFFIVPYNMRIDKLSWMVQDDDGNVDGGADSRVGLWTVDSMAAEDTITTISGTKTHCRCW